MRNKDGFFKLDIQLFAGTAFSTQSGSNILPATTDLKIAWTTALADWDNFNNYFTTTDSYIRLYTTDFPMGDMAVILNIDTLKLYEDGYLNSCGDTNTQSCSTYKYFVIDISSLTESQRTITNVDSLASTYGLTWEDLNPASTWTVSFNSNSGSAVGDIEDVEDDTTITAPTAPTRSGYTFSGWYKEVGLTNLWNFSTDTVTADTTLYAKWEITLAHKHYLTIKKLHDDLENTKYTATTATITVANWASGTSVVKTVTGVTATNIIWASPTPASRAKAVEFDVHASAQGTNTVTFTASETPDAEIIFNIIIGGE